MGGDIDEEKMIFIFYSQHFLRLMAKLVSQNLCIVVYRPKLVEENLKENQTLIANKFIKRSHF